MLTYVLSFLRSEDGISSVEYAMIAVAIAIVVLAAANGVGTNLTAAFNSIRSRL